MNDVIDPDLELLFSDEQVRHHLELLIFDPWRRMAFLAEQDRHPRPTADHPLFTNEEIQQMVMEGLSFLDKEGLIRLARSPKVIERVAHLLDVAVSQNAPHGWDDAIERLGNQLLESESPLEATIPSGLQDGIYGSGERPASRLRFRTIAYSIGIALAVVAIVCTSWFLFKGPPDKSPGNPEYWKAWDVATASKAEQETFVTAQNEDDSKIRWNITPGHEMSGGNLISEVSEGGVLHVKLQPLKGKRLLIELSGHPKKTPTSLVGFVFLDRAENLRYTGFIVLDRRTESSSWAAQRVLTSEEVSSALGNDDCAEYRFGFVQPHLLRSSDLPDLETAIGQDRRKGIARPWEAWFTKYRAQVPPDVTVGIQRMLE